MLLNKQNVKSNRGDHTMIKGVHTMFYSSEPEKLREFIRDKLGFSATDVGEGWLIFDLPEADMGVHPLEKGEAMGPPSGIAYISFYCDNLKQTVKELRSRGVEFTDEISDAGYGLTTHFKMPGNFEAELYQPFKKGQ
jgi:catechol 2,3-dioxygenase-like lactoylglutathione lyase family enzyme